MALNDYYKEFWLQAWTPQDDGFGGVQWALADGLKIMGGLSKARQGEVRVAEAQGLAAQYDFMTDIRLKLERDDVIRRVSNDTLYRITGLPEKSPEVAVSQFQLLPVELVTRESVARGFSP
jgi:hypothetical protein